MFQVGHDTRIQLPGINGRKCNVSLTIFPKSEEKNIQAFFFLSYSMNTQMAETSKEA